jgi:tryptophanyl-tRNA synthetase
VIVSHITEESNIADHTVMNKVDRINISLGGEDKIYQGIENGLIKCMGVKIKATQEVIEMIQACDTRRAERTAKKMVEEKEYNTHYNNVARMV